MNYLDILNKRFACKRFDDSRKISDQDKQIILEAGRLSPSSFGLEPWQFVLIKDADLRTQLKPACWDQAQITDSSFIIIILNRAAYHFRPNSPYVLKKIARRQLPEAMQKAYESRVQGYLSVENTREWTKRQCYIALSNMLNAAQSLGISSCPIEGYESEKVIEILKNRTSIDFGKFELSGVICAFGYSAMEQPKKYRAPMDEIAVEI